MRQMFEYVRLNRRYPSIWANVWMRRNRCIHDSFALPMMHTWFVEGEWHIRQRVSSTQNRDKWTWAQISNPLQAMLDKQLQLSHSRIQGILDTSSRVIAWFEAISRRMSVAVGSDPSCIALQCSLAFTSSCRDNKCCMQRYQYTHQEADLSMKGPHTYSLME